jgi:hypothetical protein
MPLAERPCAHATPGGAAQQLPSTAPTLQRRRLIFHNAMQARDDVLAPGNAAGTSHSARGPISCQTCTCKTQCGHLLGVGGLPDAPAERQALAAGNKPRRTTETTDRVAQATLAVEGRSKMRTDIVLVCSAYTLCSDWPAPGAKLSRDQRCCSEKVVDRTRSLWEL